MPKKTETLTLEMIKEQFYLWSIRFRETFLTQGVIEILSREYLEDLESEGVTARQFKWAARHVSKRCKYFPKMADLLDAVDTYRAKPQQSDRKTIAYDPTPHLTPEQEERGKFAAKVASYAVSNKISFEEAWDVLATDHGCEDGGC